MECRACHHDDASARGARATRCTRVKRVRCLGQKLYILNHVASLCSAGLDHGCTRLHCGGVGCEVVVWSRRPVLSVDGASVHIGLLFRTLMLSPRACRRCTLTGGVLIQWQFVVGVEGIDCTTWTFHPERAEPQVLDGMLVRGRNAKRLAELLNTSEAQLAGLSPAEVVGLRLYTGASWCLLCIDVGR